MRCRRSGARRPARRSLSRASLAPAGSAARRRGCRAPPAWRPSAPSVRRYAGGRSRSGRHRARTSPRSPAAAPDPPSSGALIRKSAIAMLMTALTVASRRAAAVDRRSECSASTTAARASSAPIRDAGYSDSPNGVASASTPSARVTTARLVTRRRGGARPRACLTRIRQAVDHRLSAARSARCAGRFPQQPASDRRDSRECRRVQLLFDSRVERGCHRPPHAAAVLTSTICCSGCVGNVDCTFSGANSDRPRPSEWDSAPPGRHGTVSGREVAHEGSHSIPAHRASCRGARPAQPHSWLRAGFEEARIYIDTPRPPTISAFTSPSTVRTGLT